MSELEDFKKGNFNYCEQSHLADGTMLIRLSKQGKAGNVIRVSGISPDKKSRSPELVETFGEVEDMVKLKELVNEKIKRGGK